MDLMMPRMDGIEATRRITEANPEVRVLVLTSFAADDKVFPAVKAGALGYLLKDTGPKELLRGHPPRPPRRALAGARHRAQGAPRAFAPRAKQKPTTDPLTERELEVLRLISKGLSNKEIAAAIFIAEMDGPDPREQHPGQAAPRQPHPGGASCPARRPCLDGRYSRVQGLSLLFVSAVSSAHS